MSEEEEDCDAPGLFSADADASVWSNTHAEPLTARRFLEAVEAWKALEREPLPPPRPALVHPFGETAQTIRALAIEHKDDPERFDREVWERYGTSADQEMFAGLQECPEEYKGRWW